jgi:hypothetical protein
MALSNHRVILALALMSAPCCSPDSDVQPREINTALPANRAFARYIAVQANPKEEFVRLGFADYVGGTFGWTRRFRGILIGARETALEFVLPPDGITVIQLRDIRAAEIGGKPGPDVTGFVTFLTSGPHYLTLRYADGKGVEQILVLDLAVDAVNGTLEFIEHGGIRIVHH